MANTKLCYILIDSTTQVIKAEKILKSQAIPFGLVPKPRQLTSDCGMCIACSPTDLDAVTRTLSLANIYCASIHQLETPTEGFLARLLKKL